MQSEAIKNAPAKTTFMFNINDITLEGWTYDPSSNVETGKSLFVPDSGNGGGKDGKGDDTATMKYAYWMDETALSEPHQFFWENSQANNIAGIEQGKKLWLYFHSIGDGHPDLVIHTPSGSNIVDNKDNLGNIDDPSGLYCYRFEEKGIYTLTFRILYQQVEVVSLTFSVTTVE